MKDKVAYITGGTKGIGFGIAQVLLKHGIKVAVSGRKQEDAEEAARILSDDDTKVFGIASDGTMYFLTKYRQELRRHGGSISKTVSNAIYETGPGMIYTAVILFSGFFIFTASSFGGTAALGVLISITLLIGMISNLIFLPTLLLSLEKRIITRAFMKEQLIQMFDEDEDVELDDLQIRRDTDEDGRPHL